MRHLVHRRDEELSKLVLVAFLATSVVIGTIGAMQPEEPPVEEQWEAHGQAKGRREASADCAVSLAKASAEREEAVSLAKSRGESIMAAKVSGMVAGMGQQGRRSLATACLDSPESCPVDITSMMANVPGGELGSFDAFVLSEERRISGEKERKMVAEEAKAKAAEAAEKAKETARYNAPLRCVDGTLSPSCTCGRGNRVGDYRGCCSHHHGVAGCSAD